MPASLLEVPLEDPVEDPADEDPLEVPVDVDVPPLELVPVLPESGVELGELLLLLHPPTVNKTPSANTPRASAQIVAR